MSFQDLLDDPTLPRIVLVEVMPYDSGGAVERRIGFASSDIEEAVVLDGFLWEARLLNSFKAETSITNSGFDIGGFASPTFGRIDIAIGDTSQTQDSTGTLRDLLDLNWDGRDLVVYMGEPGAAFGAYGVLFSGTVEDVVWNESIFSLVLRDLGAPLDDPIQETVFAGSGGLEGGNDLKDEIKPLLYGIRINIAPILTDSATQIYVVHDSSINAVLDVFDAGVQLTNAGDITTLSLPALVNWTPVGGEYITDLANGAIRVGAEPFGPLTMDAEGDDTGSYVNKAADIIQRIITSKSPLVVGDLDTASFTALNTDEPGPIGVYLTKRINTRTVIDQILKGIVAFGVARADGKIEVGKLKFATSVETIEETDVVAIERKETSNPAWRVKINYKPIGVVQDDLAVNLPPNTANSPFNLFLPNANDPHTGTTFAYLDKELLINIAPDLIVGDIISAGAWVTDPTSDVDNARIQMLFWDDADAQQGSTAEGNFVDTAASATRTVVEGVTIPANATKITVQVVSDANGADLDIQRAMMNRGTLALPFVEVVTADQNALEFNEDRTYIKFDGSVNGSRLEVVDDDAWDFEASEAGTVEGKVWVDALGAAQVFVSKNFTGTGPGWAAGVTSSGIFQIWLGNGTTAQQLFHQNKMIAGRWNHFAFTRTAAGVVTSYLNDAKSDTTKTENATMANSAALIFGARVSTLDELTGRERDMRRWSDVRTQQEIIDNTFEDLVGDEPGFIGFWPFREGTGKTAFQKVSGAPVSDAAFITAGPSWSGVVGEAMPNVEVALTDDGDLSSGVGMDQGDGIIRLVPFGPQYVSGRDGDGKTFDDAYAVAPLVSFIAGGGTFDGTGLSNTAIIQNSIQATLVTASGLTIVAELKETASSIVGHIDGDGAGPETAWNSGNGPTDPDWQAGKGATAAAWNNLYTWKYDVSVNGFPDPGDITLGFYTNINGAGWIKQAQRTHFSSVTGATKSATIVGLSTAGPDGDLYGVDIESAGGATLDDVVDVRYDTATVPAIVTATPTGAEDVVFRVEGGVE